LSRAICDNLDDIESLQPFAFLTVDGFNNQRKACRGTGIPSVNLKLWSENPEKPQQLNAAVFPQAEKPVKQPFDNEIDFDFEQYLKDKKSAESAATSYAYAPESALNEIPRPLSREQYYHVFDNEPDNPLFNGDSNDLDLDPEQQQQVKGSRRSSMEHSEKRMLDDLFNSAREEAFEDKQLFY
jgi:hypothetical protein